jgi:hypothetical protein
MSLRALWILIALSLSTPAGATAAAAPVLAATVPIITRLATASRGGTEDADVVARAFDSVLVWRDLDAVLLSRHAMAKEGRGALRHLAESRVLEIAGRENGIEVSERVVEARWKDLDQQILASGDKQGIAGYLRRGRLTRDSFLIYLRLAVVQETLTRRALGLRDDAAVSGEQQQLWMDDALKARRYEEFLPPWKEGLAARAAEFTITIPEFVRYMRAHLPEESLRDDCYHALLERRLRARMPDLAAEKLDQYVAEEIQRRRDEAAMDPRYSGVPYDRLIAAQGIVLETLPQDPSIRVAALARAWVDRSYSADDLRRVYNDEREHFDGLFGASIDTYMIFLRAAELTNDFNPRTFVAAEAELKRWKPDIHSLDDFKRLAREKSEDAPTRESGGSLEWITALSPRVPGDVRAEVARALAIDGGGPGLVGPVRTPTGCMLLWLGERRPGASWDAMQKQVHRELRRRFVEEVLPRSRLSTQFEEE